MNALDRIAQKLRAAGASLPVESKGTIESAMATGLSIALALVESERQAAHEWHDIGGNFQCSVCEAIRSPSTRSQSK